MATEHFESFLSVKWPRKKLRDFSFEFNSIVPPFFRLNHEL